MKGLAVVSNKRRARRDNLFCKIARIDTDILVRTVLVLAVLCVLFVGFTIKLYMDKRAAENEVIRLQLSPVYTQDTSSPKYVYKEVQYEVQWGDSLYSLASEYGTTNDLRDYVSWLERRNELRGRSLQCGEVITILVREEVQ